MTFPSALRARIPNSVKKLNRQLRVYRRFVSVRQQYGPDESTLASALAVARLALFPTRTILFYPAVPDQWQIVSKACALNGYRVVGDPRDRHDVAHKHEKETHLEEYEFLQRPGRRVINASANDVSKTHVQEVFGEVFGYQLAVDPRTYHGKAVRKSDANYQHDGAIIDCPFEPGEREDVVYQKLVETDNGKGSCVDLRVPIYGGEIPLVYVKLRPADNRFETFNSAEIVETASVLSADEVEQIGAFAQAMGVDFAEMDVLRDNDDGRIYVVDVNNTPAGPPVHLSAEEQSRAVARLAAAYGRLVEAYAS